MFIKELASSGKEVLQLRCSPFLGILRARGDKYDFAVRHIRRNELLIWGSDFDFDTAVREVSRMLLGLQNRFHQAERLGRRRQSPLSAFS